MQKFLSEYDRGEKVKRINLLSVKTKTKKERERERELKTSTELKTEKVLANSFPTSFRFSTRGNSTVLWQLTPKKVLKIVSRVTRTLV